MKDKKVQFITQFAALTAVEAIFCFTPLGSLPAFGPIVATLMMIPVIITSLVLGMTAGAAMGAVAGLFSFMVWTFTPPSPITAFLFTPFYYLGEYSGNFGSLVICFVPRILAGAVAAVVYNACMRISDKNEVFKMAAASALGSLTNTFGVMGGIWMFFAEQYSALAGRSMPAIIAFTVLTSGIPEAVVAAVLCPAVSKPLKIIIRKNRS